MQQEKTQNIIATLFLKFDFMLQLNALHFQSWVIRTYTYSIRKQYIKTIVKDS